MSARTVGEIVAVIGVLLGLVFVGWEIRQNTVVARAATRQALVENSIQFTLSRATDPNLNRQIADFRNATEEDRLDCNVRHAEACGWIFGLLRHHENLFLQVREGVVDDSAFDSYGYRFNPTYTSPIFADYWASLRARFNPDFVAAFEAEYDLAP